MRAGGSVTQLTDGSTSAEPWISDDAGTVYYTRSGSADPRHAYEVWKSDIATGAETLLYRLLEHPGQVRSPEASPTGDRVAFAMAAGDDLRTRIAIVRVADGSLSQYSAPAEGEFFSDDEPTLSYDGERMAYLRIVSTGADQASSVRVIDLATRHETVAFTVTGNLTLHDLQWSADGTSLLVTQEGVKSSDGGGTGQALSIDPSTGDAIILADDVPAEATYTSADGTEVSAVGLTREQLADESQSHDAGLITWRDAHISVTPLSVSLKHAQNLTIARCSLLSGATDFG